MAWIVAICGCGEEGVVVCVWGAVAALTSSVEDTPADTPDIISIHSRGSLMRVISRGEVW